ncbi:MAG: hypothetical protein SFW66_01665 [Gammaproteobacteria bacterium]|nr:hypothetical protein [Gammaproteobacteria bacterium]
MFDRIQKPFLTVETGEAYQPVRLAYDIHDRDALIATLEQLSCIEFDNVSQTWTWYWRDECDDLHFESVDSFRRRSENVIRLASLQVQKNHLYVNLRSFKRACLAVPFFYRYFERKILELHHADFINKVFGTDERITHGFVEMFSEEELEAILKQRLDDYYAMQARCENAETAEEAFGYLAEYSQAESKKRLPYAERYAFLLDEVEDPDVIFLGFYIYLRGRELVAIKRWFGETGYSLSDAADQIIESVFGGIGVDLLE